MHELIEDIYKETGQKNAIEDIKSTLPSEISKQALAEFKQDTINARTEMIDIPNNHRDMLNKMHSQTIDSIEAAINNNTNSLVNHINNSMLYLGLFGIFCGIMGRLCFFGWLRVL